jgi:precorrin-6B C5,15-methyltransferase / cobalt-precorrin-6B C5,C15-methyltransferase
VPERIFVLGVNDRGSLPEPPWFPMETADLIVGGQRHLDEFGLDGLAIGGDVGAVLDAIAAEPGKVCVLASGDPGFFGIVRPLAERFGTELLDVHPAPSSVSLAFARLGLPWDDAVVVSAHGRALDAARLHGPKVAVLTSPDNPPELVGKLLDGDDGRSVAVCSRLGTDDEAVVRTDVRGLASGTWDPLSVVLLIAGDGVGPKSVTWGASDDAYAHRAGMITKSEVRAVVLAKLELPATGVLWDVGAGSGSVAIECAQLCPGLRVIAVERVEEDVERIHGNARKHCVDVEVVTGDAPGILDGLPDPDRVFVGGGGIEVLDAVLVRCSGRVVATYAALDRAAIAAERLGQVVQVGVNRGERLPDGGLRLAAENPVFVVWGEQL